MDNLSKRSYIIIAIFLIVGFVYISRLFALQVVDTEYKQFATNNVLREVVQYPARGLIYDRNGKLMVINKPAYDLLITPREVSEFDTLVLCNLLEISKDELEAKISEAKDYSTYRPSILVKQISPETYATLQEQLYKFKGFHAQSRTLREYETTAASHVLGYVSEVDDDDLKNDSYYRMGDYIGESGIEKTYETQLRGKKGVKKYLVDVHNRIQGSYLNGQQDTPAQIGKNLTSTLDLDLQLYAEELLQNRKGSVVAIEPSTGEVLAMVSAPMYDPGLLVGRVRGQNYLQLQSDTLQPLFNRALQAEYPPGSTFKVLNALVALQEGAINLNTRFSCAGPSSRPISCTHDHITPLSLTDAIKESCNSFFWNTFSAIMKNNGTSAESFNVWRDYVVSFGLGQKISSDFPGQREGNVPTEEYYNNIYGSGHWNDLTVRSLSIGQGELGLTPLQLANYCATIANRGYYYVPHVVKEIEGEEIKQEFETKKYAEISEEYFEMVIDGMQKVVETTNTSIYMRIPDVTMCGKTGTAENPQGEDHSVFMAFAPKDDPKIAISVYVENSGYGATSAAPIASLLVEKYLTGKISESRQWIETRMLDANYLNINQPQ